MGQAVFFRNVLLFPDQGFSFDLNQTPCSHGERGACEAPGHLRGRSFSVPRPPPPPPLPSGSRDIGSGNKKRPVDSTEHLSRRTRPAAPAVCVCVFASGSEEVVRSGGGGEGPRRLEATNRVCSGFMYPDRNVARI